MKRLMKFFLHLFQAIARGLFSTPDIAKIKDKPMAPSVRLKGSTGQGMPKLRRKIPSLPWWPKIWRYPSPKAYTCRPFNWTFSRPQIVGRVFTWGKYKYRVLERVEGLTYELTLI